MGGNGELKMSKKEYMRLWKQKNKEKVRLANQKYRENLKKKNPEKYKEQRKRYKANWKKKNPEKYKEQKRKYFKCHPFARRLASLKGQSRKRGYTPPTITAQELQQLFESSDGLCGCCKEPMLKWCIDHDHKTGRVRGIVCSDCNWAEGHIRTVKRAQALMEYIKKNEDN